MLKDESKFLNKIKDVCIEESQKYNILPSVLAALAITISKWGSSKAFHKTQNVYLLTVNNNWQGKCYSKKLDKIYNTAQESTDSNLYRVYDNYKNSIRDFVLYLLEARRSESGPYKYQGIVQCLDYKKSIDILHRAGLFDILDLDQDINQYASNLIAIIEKYKLYNWDSSIKNLSISKNDLENTETKCINENLKNNIYRVRLDWDKRDTQIFASASYEDCLSEALKHEGYKIYADDGKLVKDPWIKIESSDSLTFEKEAPKPSICVRAGQPIVLDNTPIYKNTTDKGSVMKLSGVFYFYDNGIINGRAKIIKDKAMAQTNLKYVLGYINIK